jgi:hypothetical protein
MMALRNFVKGKRPPSEPEPKLVTNDRPTHAPMFARSHDEPEPNAVSGVRLQPAQPRPRREASRTLAEARKLGLSMPEALDLTPEEINSQG